jgi:hypothetical protein
MGHYIIKVEEVDHKDLSYKLADAPKKTLARALGAAL